jgi:hypothetical protein
MDDQQEVNKPPETPGEKPAESAAKQAPRGLTLKVSEKGGLSVYGLGRFPVTLYKEQWTRLLGMAEEIREFIKANDGALKSKSQ